MLISLLAKLIVVYGLLNLPAGTPVRTIDVSNYAENGQIVLAVAQKINQAPARNNWQSLGMEISAPAAIIKDKNSGAILWQKNPEQVRSIASLTKLMTALVFLENNPGWEKTITIKAEDYKEGGRQVYQGEEIKIADLFKITLIASDNTAAQALVRSTGKSEQEFVKLMNAKSKNLGLSSTVFYEPTGLNAKNQSTAEELLVITSLAFDNPEIAKTTVMKSHQFEILNKGNKRSVKSTDLLLDSYLNITAGKTGSLDQAGYCFSARVRGEADQEIDIVILGSDSHFSRFQEFKALAQWAFDNFDWTD